MTLRLFTPKCLQTKISTEFEIRKMKRIRTKVSSSWKIKYDDGSIQLAIVDTGFTIEEVVDFIKVHHPKQKFVVSAVNVGIFNLRTTNPVENSYQSDGRSMTQNKEITIDL